MILYDAAQVLKKEAEGILGLISRLDHNFIDCIKLMSDFNSRVIVSGVGKSGIIGKKISATFNSTGTKSIFLHPVEAIHGDLGVISKNDIFLAISYSGETDELNSLLPSIDEIGCIIISLTGNINSTLSKNSDITIDVIVKQEACPMGLAPTTSTTALLAMGDALAVVLINKKKFRSCDFKKNHPGGALGQRLSSSIKDIMLRGKKIPIINSGVSVIDAVNKMNLYGLGVVIVSNIYNELKGIVTDGDIRRFLIKGMSFLELSVDEIMTKKPYKSYPELSAYDALDIMEKQQVTVLPIIDYNNRIKGILHLHDILGKGAFKFRNV